MGKKENKLKAIDIVTASAVETYAEVCDKYGDNKSLVTYSKAVAEVFAGIYSYLTNIDPKTVKNEGVRDVYDMLLNAEASEKQGARKVGK